jgi:hypothetical protein
MSAEERVEVVFGSGILPSIQGIGWGTD